MKFNFLEITQRIDFCLHNRILFTMVFLYPRGAIKWYLRISKPMGTIFAESARSNPSPKYVKHSRQEVQCPQAKNAPQRESLFTSILKNNAVLDKMGVGDN
jgi:hypothetical protein